MMLRISKFRLDFKNMHLGNNMWEVAQCVLLLEVHVYTPNSVLYLMQCNILAILCVMCTIVYNLL